MSDIVERLKSQDELYHQPNFGWEIDENKIEPLCMDAVNEILRLRAENEKLRAALKPFAKCVATYPNAEDDYEIGFGCVHDAECKVFIRDFRAAAAALKETGDE